MWEKFIIMPKMLEKDFMPENIFKRLSPRDLKQLDIGWKD